MMPLPPFRRTRVYAQAIVRLRAIAIQGFVRMTADQPDDDLSAEFDFIVRSLPWSVREGQGLTRRVVRPVERIIARDGLLRYVDPTDHHTQAAVAANPNLWRDR